MYYGIEVLACQSAEVPAYQSAITVSYQHIILSTHYAWVLECAVDALHTPHQMPITIFAYQMKLIALILSVFIFSLAIVPCTDAQTCVDETTTEIASTGHDHSHDHPDACPPFCTCHCCGTTYAFSTFEKEKSLIAAILFDYSFNYRDNYSRDHLDRIWQPPVAC